MRDDIVTRLRENMRGCENRNCLGCEVESEAANEIEDLRAELEECRRQYLNATHDRDRWRKIAGKLISGAEHQLDDLCFARIPLNNPKWIEAWQAYDEAVRGE